jgi:hypothetical protein
LLLAFPLLGAFVSYQKRRGRPEIRRHKGRRHKGQVYTLHNIQSIANIFYLFIQFLILVQ